MHLFPWNHVAGCAFLIFNRKRRRRRYAGTSDESNFRVALKGNSEELGFPFIESAHSIPELEQCFHEFITACPAYQSSNQLDQLRSDEYFHLADPEAKVCLDYCGFGLFSYLQSSHLSESSSFSLSEIAGSLRNHALHVSSEKGTAEGDFKAVITAYLNTPENEYSLVFTVCRGSAFRLLADSYPFQSNKKLLTMFDHESQSVAWMSQSAREKGAEVCSAKFNWPSLKVCNSEMAKLLSSKKKRKAASATGLFVFPVQSRVSGVKYDYQWMALAKKHNWHVLLDAGSLGPKDMESFGMSLYRPDFIITSFYRVFGSDPTGFGCLLIKKSVIDCLQNPSNGADSGMVRIVHSLPMNLIESAEGEDGFDENGISQNEKLTVASAGQTSKVPVFSGAHTAAQVKDVINSIGGMEMTTMKSPIISEDGSFESSCWVSSGQSPSCSENSGLLDRGGKNHKRILSKETLNIGIVSDVHLLSSDVNLLSVSEDLNSLKKDAKQDLCDAAAVAIREETDGVKSNCSPSSSPDHQFHEKGLASEIKEVNENALRRESEFELKLLGRRQGNANDPELNLNLDSEQLHRYLDSWEGRSQNLSDDDRELNRREPEIVCRHIDHINMIGLNKTALRLRGLVNWLITSLSRLRLPGSDGEDGDLLVRIYGPRVRYKRGAAVAFNVRDRGGGLIHPETVQKLADRNGINLGVGFLSNIRFRGNEEAAEMNDGSLCVLMPGCSNGSKEAIIRLEVATASLGFLTNFEDVYKMWAFVARFLDPSFAGNV